MDREPLAILKLKRAALVRVKRGHPWIFSNELESTPMRIEPGSLVSVVTHQGDWIGRGYFNLNSQIRVRLLTRDLHPIDQSFFSARIAAADRLRQRLDPGSTVYRAVFSEGDGLPGLIVDRYHDVLVAQSLTAGIDQLLEPIGAALTAQFNPRAIVLRADSPVRRLEGIPLESRVLSGQLPGEIVIEKNGLRFEIDVMKGQKTGYFLDQSENHRAIMSLAEGARVLDAFCYHGAFGLHGARAGARSVLGIDESEAALALARRNAARNGYSEICRFESADLFSRLREMADGGERFDLVILDPPALTKSKEKLKQAVAGYLELNRQALRLVSPGGFLVSCSCSYQLSREDFWAMLERASRESRRTVRLIEFRGQARDHPIRFPVREGAYLKCAVLQVE